jgi:hypothetical protein
MAQRKKAKAVAAKRGKAAAKKVTRRKASNLPAGISRIDQPSTRTHGYFVRVGYHRTKDGAWRPKHRAFFGDASHGGKAKGLKSAEKWLKDVSK